MASQPMLMTDDEIHGVSPLDLTPLPPVKRTTPDELAAAVRRARAAQKSWEALGFRQRAKLLKAAARVMLERRAESIEIIRREAGKSPAQAAMTEAIGPLDYLKNWIGVVRPFLKRQKLPISALAFPGKKGWVDMVPRGVVAGGLRWRVPCS